MKAIKAALISIGLAGLVVFVGLNSVKSGETDESKEIKTATMKAGKMSDNTKRTDKEWQQLLTDEQYRVTRQCGTEPAFTGKYYDFHEKGKYVCVCCGNELFLSDTKYDSGSGWPSFFKPVEDSAIAELEDNSLGMKRIEIKCNRCGAHLGHVFEDGPNPTGLRYCVNSISLKFEPDSSAVKEAEQKDK